MKLNRVMIAAPKSGSGKTTITCMILQALKDRGEQVVSYKCGPDYIDPMFHQKGIGVSSKNLDTFFTNEEMTKALFLNDRTEQEIAVLEGVMGLFDGLGGIREEGSSYHLAKVTKTPIILVVDAKGMGRSILALLAGFLSYDKEHLIQGVLFNRMSKGYFEIIKPLIEQQLKLLVIGYFPEQKQFHIESRHLGLIMPNEITHIEKQLQKASEQFIKTNSLEMIMGIAQRAPELENNPKWNGILEEEPFTVQKPVIAVAKDEAFCFSYEDNLLMLKKYGAQIKFFSPIHDKKLPEGCNALLLGGGYPELYAKELSSNRCMCEAIKQAADNGMPIVAECGGFMYLHSRMTDKEGTTYEMAKVIDADCFYTGRLVRFGYIEIEEKTSYFLPEGERIRGHEFHYYDSTCNGDDCTAIKPVTGKKYSCVIEQENRWIGFPHLYYPSHPFFAKVFVKKAEKYKKESCLSRI